MDGDKNASDSSQRVAQELRVDTEADWMVGQPSPRRVATAPTSPSTAYATDRETVYRSSNATVAETHLIRSSGSQSQSFTEEHWSSEITSFVAAAPPKFIQVIKAYRVLTSDTPTLVVEVASEPPAIFEWFCNDKPVQQDRRRFQARHGLNITTLTVNQPEQGVYKCTARNPSGCSTSYGYITVNFEHRYSEWNSQEEVTRERSASVTYNQAPRFLHQVPNLTVAPGAEAVLDVEVDANPPARFSWFVNGREYRESVDKVELFYPKENRCVARFTIPTAGEYKVVASNVHGSAMSSGYIEINQANPSKQMRPPVAPGENIARTMMTTSQNQGPSTDEAVTTHQTMSVYEVNYSQRSSSVPRGVRHLERHVEIAKSPEPKIEIHRAVPEEPFEMVPPNLPEESAPKIVDPLHSAVFMDGQPMVLRCQIKATPSAAIVWSKDDVDVEEWVINKDVTSQVLPDGICELLNPECYPEDSGLYKCHASNPHGTAETSAYISVEGLPYKKDKEEASMSESFASAMFDESQTGPDKIILPPKFVENLTAETDAIKQLNYIRLVCRVLSKSPITVTWMKESTEIEQTEKYEIYQFDDGTQILTVHGANVSDNGVYTCRVESEHGLSSTSCEVLVTMEKEGSKDMEDVEIVATPSPQSEKDMEKVEEPFVVREDSNLIDVEIIQTQEGPGKVTEIKKEEEQFKLLVKVADSVASALVANIFVDAVKEAARKIAEESSEEEEFDLAKDMGGPPRFETSVEEYTATEGGSVRISTTVGGYPTPFVEWYFRDEKIKISENLSMSYEKSVASLNVKTVTLEDEGTYYCHATNIHGTTVLSCKLRVLPKGSDANIRISLAKYDKDVGNEKVVTNVIAHSTESTGEHNVSIVEKRRDSGSAQVAVVTKKEATPVEEQKIPSHIIVPEETKIETSAPEEVVHVQVELKDVQKNQDQQDIDAATRAIAEKFAESFTEQVMFQAQDIVLTTQPKGDVTAETQLINTQSTVVLGRDDESARRSVTMLYDDKIRLIEDRLVAAASPDLTAQDAVNMVMNTVISLKEQHCADTNTNVDVRNPDSCFDHVVTVVEPEVVQMSHRLTAPATTHLKFIDIDTILQKPSTSSGANCSIKSPSQRRAKAEHRIVVLEGASQNFQNAMTWSLKKVRRLAEEGESTTHAQIEVVRPAETSAQATTIVEQENIIADLLQVAAAASKLKLENVTVSLLRQGDSSHQQLVIEYESQVEDEVDLHLAQLEYRKEVESRQETWSRRSRYSEDDENVVGVFMEVDATCPDQNVEIVATVNMPMEARAESPKRPPSELGDASESITESSIGPQPPKFFRKLKDCQTVIGNPMQFKCIVSGSPCPEVIWSVDGDIIQENSEYKIVYEDGVSILRIEEVLIEDEGEYCCEATNSAGTVSTKCFLKVLPETTPPPHKFVEHAPSFTNLEDESIEENSFDSFEWEERKIAAMLGETTDSLFGSRNRLATSTSDFDLSKIVNYNENLEETSAFHKYFETAETIVKVTDLVQEDFVEANFTGITTSLSQPSQTSTSKTEAFFHNTRKNSRAVAITRIEKQESFAEAASPVISSISESKQWDEAFDSPFGNVENNTVEVAENRLDEPRTPLLPQRLQFKGQDIGISVSKVTKEEHIETTEGELKSEKKVCIETSLEFDSAKDNQMREKNKKQPKTEVRSTKDAMVAKLEKKTGVHQESSEITKHDAHKTEIPREPISENEPRREELEQGENPAGFQEKLTELEKIARKVEKDLNDLSHNTSNELSDDAKEIENAILKMSDQLMLQNPVSTAQAEASEELLRTTLADMILNPSRTAEEEIEMMKKPIQLLKRKLSDIENSLMEDVEVMEINETIPEQSVTTSSATPATILTPPLKTQRVPSAELVRMTPLTSNIKDQLTQLEEMINEQLSKDTPTSELGEPRSERNPVKKRKELHDIFVQINNEINTIRKYCSNKLTKKGSDAVMSVLQKVRTHVTSIVNVMAVSKKKRPSKNEGESTVINYHFKKCPPAEQIEGIMVYKAVSLETSFIQRSSTQQSSALSTSDDTWKYSDNIPTSQRASTTTECLPEEDIHVSTPIPPPRRNRSSSADTRPKTEETQPVPPPRRRKNQQTSVGQTAMTLPRNAPKPMSGRHHSLDSRCDEVKNEGLSNTPPLVPVHQPVTPSPPTKPRRSFTGNAMELLRQLNLQNPLKKRSKDESEEEPLLDEATEKEVPSESDHEQHIVPSLQKEEPFIANFNLREDIEQKSELELLEELKSMSPDSIIVSEHVEQYESTTCLYCASSIDAAFVQTTEMNTESELPMCHHMYVDCFVPMDDVSSVQMLCEESDYATDTDTSCMLRGTVNFFNRYSPMDSKMRSNLSLNSQQRYSQLYQNQFDDVEENIEDVEVNIVLKSVDPSEDNISEAQFAFDEVVVYESDLDSRSELQAAPKRTSTALSTIVETSVEKNKETAQASHPSSPDITVDIVLEEPQLSQMASSIVTDIQERPNSSANTIRETDILSDASAITDLESSIEKKFSFKQKEQHRKLQAFISQEVKQSVAATLQEDNTFDVDIEQEPELLGLVIKVIEDPLEFTSFTVLADLEYDTSDHIDVPRDFEDFTETSSFDEYEGDDLNMKTGITVSIIARSLHDGIYASLEEIPWGEVAMTVKESEMTRSCDNSVQFCVTVSESTAEERKSLRSQPSFKESQNSISEMENTLSSGNINIPSYVIKLGATATITCELNNYLPDNSNIEWYKGNNPLDSSSGKFDRISHDLLEVLIISTVEMEDNDLYSLKVNDDIFPVAYLSIEETSLENIALILTRPQTQFVMDGQPTELAVQVTCNPDEVEWMKDRRVLRDNSSMRISSREDGWSTITIRETTLEDQGTYCAILGDQKVAITLVVEERIDAREVTVMASGTESEDEDVQEYLVPPGSTATIACELEESEHQRTLRWLKNGHHINFDSTKVEHVVNGLKHYLVIHDTSSSDTGLYSVSISNTEFRVAHLAVNDHATSNCGLKRKRISNNSLNK